MSYPSGPSLKAFVCKTYKLFFTPKIFFAYICVVPIIIEVLDTKKMNGT